MATHRFVSLPLTLTLALGAASIGCGSCASSKPASPVNAVALTPADIDSLTGKPWTGTLTYLDYSTKQLTTIPSTLVVRRIPGTATPTWEVSTGFPKEPQANNTESVSLALNGQALGDELVISRTPLPGGGVAFVTESMGEDDNRRAEFHFEHQITASQYTRRKMVRFIGDAEFFERNVFVWTR